MWFLSWQRWHHHGKKMYEPHLEIVARLLAQICRRLPRTGKISSGEQFGIHTDHLLLASWKYYMSFTARPNALAAQMVGKIRISTSRLTRLSVKLSSSTCPSFNTLCLLIFSITANIVFTPFYIIIVSVTRKSLGYKSLEQSTCLGCSKYIFLYINMIEAFFIYSDSSFFQS